MTDFAVEKVDLSGETSFPPGGLYEMIDDLRDKHRFYWNDWANGYWVFTRFQDIRDAFQSPELFSNESIVPVEPNPGYRFLPSNTDPPIHMKYRAPLNRWFAPASIKRYESSMRESCQVIIDGFIDDGGVEFLSAFGDVLPSRTLTQILGLPMADAPFFAECANVLRNAVSRKNEQHLAVGTMTQLKQYFADVIADRRKHPMDPSADFTAQLMGAEIDGRRFDDEELLDTMMTLAFGSLDTTKTAMSWSTWHFATHPSDREWVVRDPSIIPSAIEEFLRVYPVVSMGRKVTQDVDFHGCPMKKGDMVLLQIQAATRDPEVFEDPTTVKLDRSPNRHIAFGASEHRCAGSHLARAELAIAMQEWHSRIPTYRLADGAEITAHSSHIDILPLVWP